MARQPSTANSVLVGLDDRQAQLREIPTRESILNFFRAEFETRSSHIPLPTFHFDNGFSAAVDNYLFYAWFFIKGGVFEYRSDSYRPQYLTAEEKQLNYLLSKAHCLDALRTSLDKFRHGGDENYFSIVLEKLKMFAGVNYESKDRGALYPDQGRPQECYRRKDAEFSDLSIAAVNNKKRQRNLLGKHLWPAYKKLNRIYDPALVFPAPKTVDGVPIVNLTMVLERFQLSYTIDPGECKDFLNWVVQFSIAVSRLNYLQMLGGDQVGQVSAYTLSHLNKLSMVLLAMHHFLRVKENRGQTETQSDYKAFWYVRAAVALFQGKNLTEGVAICDRLLADWRDAKAKWRPGVFCSATFNAKREIARNHHALTGSRGQVPTGQTPRG